MLEKLKERKQKKEEQQKKERREREHKEYLEYKYDHAKDFFDDYFYKYMAILKNTKQSCLSLSLPPYLGMVDDSYVIEVNGMTVVKSKTTTTLPTGEKLVNENYYYMDKHCICHSVTRSADGAYIHIQLEGNSWDGKTKSIQSMSRVERKIDYVEVSENNTEQEKEIIKLVDFIIEKTNACIKAENLVQRTIKSQV